MGKTAALVLGIVLLAGALGPAALQGAERCAPRADFGLYHTYDELVTELMNLTNAYPALTQLIPLRQTYEGRTIWAVKVSDNVTADEGEPNFTVFGGIHAGEWPGVEAALNVLNYLVTNYSINASVKRLVDRSQVWVVPMLNPDGHVYVETTGNWRKNRHPYTGGTGVDLNRNFGHLWGQEAGQTPNTQEYCGPWPFSENETQAVRDLVVIHRPVATISYHTSGGNILYPWGSTLDSAPVDQRLPLLAYNMSLTMPAGRRYVPERASTYYSATGDTDDYFYANLSILPFTIELYKGVESTPPDSELPAILQDNLPAALYLLGEVVGPEPPTPVNHAFHMSSAGQATVAPGGDTTVQCYLINDGDVDENITLSVSAPAGWSATAAPNAGMLLNGSAGFNLTVRAPASARAGEPAPVVINATAASGARASHTVNCTVEQVHDLSATLTGAPEATPGNVFTVKARLENKGNGMESMTLSAGVVQGWTLTIVTGQSSLRNPFNLSAGQNATLDINIQVPANATHDTQVNLTFKVRAASETILMTRNHVFVPARLQNMSIVITAKSIQFNSKENHTIPVQLRNEGNVWENGSIVLSGTEYATIGNSSAAVAPFSSQTVNLTLHGKKKGNYTVTVQFFAEGEMRAQGSVYFSVLANETVVPPAPPDPVPVIVILVIITVMSLALLYWDLQHAEEKSREEERLRKARRRPLGRTEPARRKLSENRKERVL
jgi:murein tripeptide amidase MpaA